ncbi:phage integrase [Methylopila sp. Yamaguchi]|nr:phage integrase [Methylopila sp. Yamaguchi]
MSADTNIVRRQGSSVYYARTAVPLHLREHYRGPDGKPRRELWKSLGTKDRHEARRLGLRVLSAWADEFAVKRTELEHRIPMTDADLQEAVWSRYCALVEADERFRHATPTPEQLDELWDQLQHEFGGSPGDESATAHRVWELIRDRFEIDQAEREARRQALAAGLARGQTAAVAKVARDVATKMRLDVKSGTADERKLGAGLMRAELEALKRSSERDVGDFTGEPRDALVRRPSIERAKAGEGIMDLFEKYANENPENCRADTLRQSRQSVELFVSTLPPGSPARAITKKAVREWKELLLDTPVRASDTNIFRGLALREIVAKNKALGKGAKPKIAPKTINRHLSALGAFSTWLDFHEHIDGNPTVGHYIKIDKDTPPETYTPEQLQTIFSSPMFAGDVERDYRFWVPLVQMFTGMRQGEVAQLLVKDVIEQHGRATVFITKRGGGGKTLKTAGSERVIVLHDELKRLGFLKHVEAMREAGEERLFPTATKNDRGQWIDAFSREFPRELTRLGVKQGRGLSLHTFRHNATDAMRAAGFVDEEIAPVLGHAKKKLMTSGYGRVPEDRLLRDAKLVDAIAYPGVDLSHLYSV